MEMKQIKAWPVRRWVDGRVEAGFVCADNPTTVFVSEDCEGPHWSYPDTETMQRAGWVNSSNR